MINRLSFSVKSIVALEGFCFACSPWLQTIEAECKLPWLSSRYTSTHLGAPKHSALLFPSHATSRFTQAKNPHEIQHWWRSFWHWKFHASRATIDSVKYFREFWKNHWALNFKVRSLQMLQNEPKCSDVHISNVKYCTELLDYLYTQICSSFFEICKTLRRGFRREDVAECWFNQRRCRSNRSR